MKGELRIIARDFDENTTCVDVSCDLQEVYMMDQINVIAAVFKALECDFEDSTFMTMLLCKLSLDSNTEEEDEDYEG